MSLDTFDNNSLFSGDDLRFVYALPDCLKYNTSKYTPSTEFSFFNPEGYSPPKVSRMYQNKVDKPIAF